MSEHTNFHGSCEVSQSPTLSVYYDGELSKAEMSRIEAHVAGCADCQAALASMHSVSAWTKTGFASVFAPADTVDRVLQQAAAEWHELGQARRVSELYAATLLIGLAGLVSFALSPFGMALRALGRLLLAVLRGSFHVLSTFGSGSAVWVAGVGLFICAISIVGAWRVLRSTLGEATT